MSQKQYTPEVLDRIRDLISRGYSPNGAANVLGLNAGTLRHKVAELGLSKHARDTRHKVRIGAEIFTLLQRSADLRGVSVAKLASQILSAVVFDDLINAVVDDDFARQRKLQQASKNRASYKQRRRNGEPILSPKDAALAGCKTRLLNAGLMPDSPPAPQPEIRIQFESPHVFAMQMAPQLDGLVGFAADQPRIAAQGLKPRLQ